MSIFFILWLFYRFSKIICSLLAVTVIGINLFFVVTYLPSLPHHWAMYTFVAVIVIAYLAFITYLVSSLYKLYVLFVCFCFCLFVLCGGCVCLCVLFYFCVVLFDCFVYFVCSCLVFWFLLDKMYYMYCVLKQRSDL